MIQTSDNKAVEKIINDYNSSKFTSNHLIALLKDVAPSFKLSNWFDKL
jgi:hypothetical protein